MWVLKDPAGNIHTQTVESSPTFISNLGISYQYLLKMIRLKIPPSPKSALFGWHVIRHP
jgi:hypothetical protein